MQFPPELVVAHPEHPEHRGTAENERTESFQFNAGWVLEDTCESSERDGCRDHVGPVLQVHCAVRVGEV